MLRVRETESAMGVGNLRDLDLHRVLGKTQTSRPPHFASQVDHDGQVAAQGRRQDTRRRECGVQGVSRVTFRL